jgi:hypothetical protein
MTCTHIGTTVRNAAVCCSRRAGRSVSGMCPGGRSLTRLPTAAGKARRRVAAELIADLERIYQRKKATNTELRDLVAATGTSLIVLHGIGPSS